VVLATQTPELRSEAVSRAVERLRAGELVALPTETVYGLAANAFDAEAVARIFAAKGRPADNPVIVHVADLELARRCVSAWPPEAERLAAAFWPGPLTLVLPRAPVVPDVVTAGGPTVGLRWPSHPVFQDVVRACGFPLAAPSANRSGELSPTTAEHVLRSLGERVPLILDGGRCAVGIESTVVDLSVRPPRVLRPGMVHEGSLRAVVGELAAGEARGRQHAEEPLRSPGLLGRHYAPRARLLVFRWDDDADLRRQSAAAGLKAADTQVVAHTHVPSAEGWAGVRALPREAQAFAAALYAELHETDAEGAVAVVVEAPPEAPEWRAVADRLARASVG
jgi:L-threonylcarbamoyladenylate synthase